MSEVRIPRNIRAQLEQAAVIEKQIADAVIAAAQATTPVAALGVPANVAEPLKVENQPPATPPVPPLAPAVDDFEQRYRTLQGKYSAELPRLQQELNQRQRQESELRQQLNTLQEQVAQLQKAPPTSPVMDPKDVESFGAEMVSMVQRQASVQIELAVRDQLGALVGRLDNLEKQVHGVNQNQNVTAEQQFQMSLSAQVPDWRVINEVPKFLEWLGETDPMYGEPRQEALNRASHALSVDRTAAVFNAYKRTLPVDPPAQASASLKDQVAPARSSAAAAPVQTGPQRVSSADITAFYNDVRRGKYRGREAEVERIEAEINAALAEGRVV